MAFASWQKVRTATDVYVCVCPSNEDLETFREEY